MAWNNPFTRAAMHRMMNDPKVRQMFGKVQSTVRSHPAAQKFASQMRSQFANLFERKIKPTGTTSSGTGKTGASRGGGGGASGSNTAGMFASARRYWEQHRERVLAFVAANFMGILFFLQFGSQLWHMFIALLRSLLSVEDDKHKDARRINDDQQRKKKKSQQQQQQQQQSGDIPRRLAVASSTAETPPAEHDDAVLDAFTESFQFKIGDTTEFTGSLSSTAVTGASSDSFGGDRLGDGDGTLYFDLRSPQLTPTRGRSSPHTTAR